MFGKEPAIVIGTIVTIVVGAIATLSGNGFISDVVAGKATDIVNATAQLAVLLAPLIAGILTRPNVTPVAAPTLPVGTAVETPNGGAAKVTPA